MGCLENIIIIACGIAYLWKTKTSVMVFSSTTSLSNWNLWYSSRIEAFVLSPLVN